MRREFCSSAATVQTMAAMATKKYSFKELLEDAARSVPHLWTDDDRLNLSAVARYYKKKGYPIPQPTLQRLCTKEHGKPSDNTINATYHVFGIPRALLRGEPMRPEMEEQLAEYKLSTLFLAKKIESLPKAFRDSIYAQIEAFLDQREQLSRAPNVTVLDRDRPHR